MGFDAWTTKLQFRKLCCGTKHFYSFFFTPLLSWTWCSHIVHFLWMAHFLYFSWSIKSFLCVGSERLFWNSLARLMSYLWFEVCISICVSYPAAQVSCTCFVKIERNLLDVLFKPSKTLWHVLVLRHCYQLWYYVYFPNRYTKYNVVAFMCWT